MKQLIIGVILGLSLSSIEVGAQVPPMPPTPSGNRQMDQMNQQMYQQQLHYPPP